MATFTNQATLTYNGGTVNSNIVTGELVQVLTASKTAAAESYRTGDLVTYVVQLRSTGAAALTGLLSWLLRGRRRSLLTSVVLTLCTIALFALSIEFFADRFAGGPWRPGWSLVVLTVCVALCIPLIVVRNVPNLREEARRRFHL